LIIFVINQIILLISIGSVKLHFRPKIKLETAAVVTSDAGLTKNGKSNISVIKELIPNEIQLKRRNKAFAGLLAWSLESRCYTIHRDKIDSLYYSID